MASLFDSGTVRSRRGRQYSAFAEEDGEKSQMATPIGGITAGAVGLGILGTLAIIAITAAIVLGILGTIAYADYYPGTCIDVGIAGFSETQHREVFVFSSSLDDICNWMTYYNGKGVYSLNAGRIVIPGIVNYTQPPAGPGHFAQNYIATTNRSGGSHNAIDFMAQRYKMHHYCSSQVNDFSDLNSEGFVVNFAIGGATINGNLYNVPPVINTTTINTSHVLRPGHCIEAPVNLGLASTFSVLASSTVTNTGFSTVTGNLGVSPGSAVTGFPPGIVVAGTIQAATTPAANAKTALTAAYNDAAGRSCSPITIAGDIGGQTLYPDLYKSTSSILISTGDLTLDALGDPSAVWIFQIASTITVGSGRKMILVGGAQAGNVFWQIGSSATFGTTSIIKGIVMADISITFDTGATLDGSALASNGAVTLDSNLITITNANVTANVTGNCYVEAVGNYGFNWQVADFVAKLTLDTDYHIKSSTWFIYDYAGINDISLISSCCVNETVCITYFNTLTLANIQALYNVGMRNLIFTYIDGGFEYNPQTIKIDPTGGNATALDAIATLIFNGANGLLVQLNAQMIATMQELQLVLVPIAPILSAINSAPLLSGIRPTLKHDPDPRNPLYTTTSAFPFPTYLDELNTAGFGGLFTNTFYYDDNHPTEAGYRALAKTYEKILNSQYKACNTAPL